MNGSSLDIYAHARSHSWRGDIYSMVVWVGELRERSTSGEFPML